MTYFNLNDKIFVAGHRGMVGKAVVRKLKQLGFTNLVTRTRSELDLCNQAAVNEFFQQEKPKLVFLCAAKVGGILANNTYRADFIYQNTLIQTNVIGAAHQNGVDRLLFLGSSCIYPKDCPQPIKEEYLLTGSLEYTNQPYALAKINGVEMCWAFNQQYKTKYLAVMPTNLYGPGDTYDIQNSHVIPALIIKAVQAKQQQAKNFTVWGTGTVRREFMLSDDMADACVYLAMLNDQAYAKFLSAQKPPLINIGVGKDCTIAQIATLIKELVGFKGEIIFDHSKPDGTKQKLLDISKLTSIGWQAQHSLRDGLKIALEDFYQNHAIDKSL